MKKTGLIYVFITAILFASFEPVSKLIAGQIAPLTMTFFRFFSGSVVLLPFAIYIKKKKNIKLTSKTHLHMLLVGILCVCISMTLLQFAILKSSSPALMSIIFSCNSVLTIVLASAVLKEKITPKKIIAVILCLIGIIICSWRNLSQKGELLSVILATLSAITFSVYTVFNKKIIKEVKSSDVVMAFSFFYGSIVLLLVLLCMGTNLAQNVNMSTIPTLLYIGIAVTGIGYWAYSRALEKSSATTASLAFFIKPVLAPFFSFFIAQTPLTAEVFIALIFIVTGSYLASYSDK